MTTTIISKKYAKIPSYSGELMIYQIAVTRKQFLKYFIQMEKIDDKNYGSELLFDDLI